MSTEKKCDYCRVVIPSGDDPEVTVSVFQGGKVDKRLLEKDACVDCTSVVTRLLNKPIERLKQALAAVSDR